MNRDGRKRNVRLAVGVGGAVLYGLTLYGVARVASSASSDLLMTNGLLFGFPFALGAMTVYFSGPCLRGKIIRQAFAPWMAVAFSLAGALAFRLEGVVMVILAAPAFLVMSSLGGVVMGQLPQDWKTRARGRIMAGLLMALPIVSAEIETRRPLPQRITEVSAQIAIEAGPEIVWRNFTRVPEISPGDSRFFGAVGLPRPVAADLSGEGVGGTRRAVYEGGFGFTQRITAWEPPRRFGFEFRADPGFAINRHVSVGGTYFDLTSGEYLIEQPEPGRVILHFRSTHRLSTRFNFYAGLWTDFLLRQIQARLLEVIRKNSEAMMKQP